MQMGVHPVQLLHISCCYALHIYCHIVEQQSTGLLFGHFLMF